MRHLPSIFLLIVALTLGVAGVSRAQSTQPVFCLDFRSPTADKPQSKLWYAGGRWWALLPRTSGPALWERSATGWREHPEATTALAGVPGRADVWAESAAVTAVTVDTQSMHVIRLVPGDSWTGSDLATLALPSRECTVESATIARDGSGQWWVAAAAGKRPGVWQSKDAVTWTEFIGLGEGIGKDDLCLVTGLADGVGVVWSDQVRDRIVMRRHINGNAPDRWEPEEIVDAGNRTADDHLKAALAPDGTLWLATKNSVDEEGNPQLVLRVRSPAGAWRNLPYAPRAAMLEPSRPAVFLTPDSARVLLGHNVYNKSDRARGYVEFGHVDVTASDVLVDSRIVIQPAASLDSWDVKDITGPKSPFPADAPWVVLASDRLGRVYEADLRGETPARVQAAAQDAAVSLTTGDASWLCPRARCSTIMTGKTSRGRN